MSSSQTERIHYLNADYGVKSWLLTIDHKRIAMLYLAAVTFFFALGGLMAVVIRIELATPGGDLVGADTYNRLFTMHGVLMIFFFLIPAIPGVLGNFLLPIMIGAKDMAFPKINLLSWYVYMAGGLFAFWSMLQGGVDTGWTFYTPGIDPRSWRQSGPGLPAPDAHLQGSTERRRAAAAHHLHQIPRRRR